MYMNTYLFKTILEKEKEDRNMFVPHTKTVDKFSYFTSQLS